MISLSIATSLRSSGNMLLVWIALVKHANKQGVTWVSVSFLASECEMSETNVYACIRKLVKRRLVKRNGRYFFVCDGVRHFPETESIARSVQSHQPFQTDCINATDARHQALKGSNKPSNLPTIIPFISARDKAMQEIEGPKITETTQAQALASANHKRDDENVRTRPLFMTHAFAVGEEIARDPFAPSDACIEEAANSAMRECAAYLASKTTNSGVWCEDSGTWMYLLDKLDIWEVKWVIDDCVARHEPTEEWPRITARTIYFWYKNKYVSTLRREHKRLILLSRRLARLYEKADYDAIAYETRCREVYIGHIADWALPDHVLERLVAEGHVRVDEPWKRALSCMRPGTWKERYAAEYIEQRRMT
jgi:hypothetical protein